MKKQKLPLGMDTEIGFPVSLLKSSTQKAVRRGEVKSALLSAKAWLHKNPNDFFRRLPIIILEDAILHPDFRKVVELSSQSARKSFIVTKEIEHFALTIIEQLAKVDVRDYDFVSYEHGYKSINIIPYIDWEDLGKQEREAVMAIKWREKMGGMRDDIKMSSFLTRIWSYRFKEKIITMRKLKGIYDQIPTKKSYGDISLKLTVNDIPLEAVDFHVISLVAILMKKKHIINLVKKYYPDDVITVEERLKSIIWKMRSGVNYKKDYFTGKPIDWFEYPFNSTPGADREKYEAIYSALEGWINNIAVWFLNKNK